MTSLEGKVIAVTGAASGIGRATAQFLASRGATISISDINKEQLDSAVQSIQEKHPSAQILASRVNVTARQEIEAWLDETVAKFGRLDGAANIAGVLLSWGPTMEEADDDTFDQTIDVNLKGVFNCMRAELQRMKSEQGGSIVNAASVAGLVGTQGLTAYTASKHGVIGLTRTGAKEAGVRGIRVNCVAPGYINTAMLQSLKSQRSQQLELKMPIPRLGEPEEVASVIAFLLSDDSRYVTGSVQTVDGGYMT